MARAFHSASPSPAAVPSSPLPSKNASGGLANLQWLLRKRANRVRHGRPAEQAEQPDDDCDDECASMFGGATPYVAPGAGGAAGGAAGPDASPCGRTKRGGGEALSRLRSAILAVLARARRGRGGRRVMGSSVTGTIFGRRRGRVHLALQTDPRAPPALMVELAAYSTGALVREMASGLVRLALECEKASPHQTTGDHHHQRRPRQVGLLEEATWRAYCNGRKCGYAVRRECGADEWRVLRAVEPVSVGAGVLPDGDSAGAGAATGEGDLMYMRAKFERVVGSRDSEAFYMVNPDGGGGPELSIYLLRV
ncbi:Protein MIZU-KUSSEI 1 [Dichanthelium oligosanthes]|uniref:Protein MIZU-KUSSEI 1 n=1 Tax=Dichanthelium oligosanthes TaxID=888268 RepID=A0A1E5V542_9POAL|nr:Protein MIZU-KUSSEI 1 [Dichanthelium oligosanthes]